MTQNFPDIIQKKMTTYKLSKKENDIRIENVNTEKAILVDTQVSIGLAFKLAEENTKGE